MDKDAAARIQRHSVSFPLRARVLVVDWCRIRRVKTLISSRVLRALQIAVSMHRAPLEEATALQRTARRSNISRSTVHQVGYLELCCLSNVLTPMPQLCATWSVHWCYFIPELSNEILGSWQSVDRFFYINVKNPLYVLMIRPLYCHSKPPLLHQVWLNHSTSA